MAHRGIYPKGVARRDEILDRALELVGSKGYSNVSLRDIAERVGVRPAALLHYFDSKEELFTEILRRRDERDEMSPSAESASASREAYLQIVRHNADVPGLIALYSRLAVDAADPDHPAHSFFVARNEMQLQFTNEFAGGHGDVPAGMPLSVDMTTRIMVAVTDGLQLQWLIDPDVDMAATIDALLEVLVPALRASTPQQPPRHADGD